MNYPQFINSAFCIVVFVSIDCDYNALKVFFLVFVVSLHDALQGLSAETSGGLLICLPREQAAAYCKDIEKQEGYQAWIIGIVEKGNRTARIIDKPRVIEVPAKEKDGELW